jgi:uncharacterized membrane protein YkoI
MQIRTVALALFAITPVAFATDTSPVTRTLQLGDVVANMESRYPGKVAAIELDASGDKAPHYHIDMRFPNGGLAKLDVDAVTLQLASREVVPLAAEPVPLLYAAAMITAAVPGQIVVAELDAMNGMTPHYDVDVRLPHGGIARLKVDAATRQIGWRTPAIIND